MGKLEWTEDVLKDTKRGGWLTKQGHGLIRKWQERFFVLKGDKLYYFKSDPFANKNAVLAGILELQGCQLARKDELISITPKNKKEAYYINSKTKNAEELSSWFSDLNLVVNPSATSTTPATSNVNSTNDTSTATPATTTAAPTPAETNTNTTPAPSATPATSTTATSSESSSTSGTQATTPAPSATTSETPASTSSTALVTSQSNESSTASAAPTPAEATTNTAPAPSATPSASTPSEAATATSTTAPSSESNNASASQAATPAPSTPSETPASSATAPSTSQSKSTSEPQTATPAPTPVTSTPAPSATTSGTPASSESNNTSASQATAAPSTTPSEATSTATLSAPDTSATNTTNEKTTIVETSSAPVTSETPAPSATPVATETPAESAPTNVNSTPASESNTSTAPTSESIVSSESQTTAEPSATPVASETPAPEAPVESATPTIVNATPESTSATPVASETPAPEVPAESSPVASTTTASPAPAEETKATPAPAATPVAAEAPAESTPVATPATSASTSTATSSESNSTNATQSATPAPSATPVATETPAESAAPVATPTTATESPAPVQTTVAPEPVVEVKTKPTWFDEESESGLLPVDEVSPQDYERNDNEDLTARLNLSKVLKTQIQEVEAENSKLENFWDDIKEARNSVVSQDEKSTTDWRSDLKFEREKEPRYDVCFCYSESDSGHVVKILMEQLLKRELKVTELKLHSDAEWKSTQRALGNSKHAIVVVHSSCLRVEPMSRCIEAVILNQLPNTTVYPILECKLPDLSESSSLIRGFFNQKPVLYLPDYLESVIAQITESIENGKPKEDKSAAEVYLSFDPATGQGISKRLYDSLKKKYYVRLAADWALESSQIQSLLRGVDKFILVLTEGYLINKSCWNQMREAMRQNLQIIVVKDFLLKVPKDIPTDLKFVLDSCVTIKWMAEFNQYCVEKLDKILGGVSSLRLDKDLDKIANPAVDVVARNFNGNHPLKINDNTLNIDPLIQALEIFLQCKVDAVSLGDGFSAEPYAQRMDNETLSCKTLFVERFGISSFALGRMVSACSHLTRLSVKSNISDDALKYITDNAVHLADLRLDTAESGDYALKYLFDRSKSIRRISIRNGKVTDMTTKFFVLSQAKLTHLEYEGCHQISAKSLTYLAIRPRKCLRNLSLIDIKLYEDNMKQFADAYNFLESFTLRKCSGVGVSLVNVKYAIDHMPNLKMMDLRGLNTVEEKHLFEVLLMRPELVCQVGLNQDTQPSTGSVDKEELKKYVKLVVKNKKLKAFAEGTKKIDLPVPEKKEPAKPAASASPAPAQTSASAAPIPTSQTTEEKMAIMSQLQKDYQAIVQQAMATQQMELVQKVAQWYAAESPKIFGTPVYVYKPYGAPEEVAAPAEPEPAQPAQNEPPKEEEKPKVEEEPNEQESIDYKVSTISATRKWEFTICYVADTGSHSSGFLKAQFDQLKLNYNSLEIPRRKAIQPAVIEEAVASSHSVVMILSEKSLAVRPFAFAMEVADHYRVGVILVHDADTCFFPAYSEQPPSVVHFFSEKAVTFLSDYTDTVTNQILTRVGEYKLLEHSHLDAHHEVGHEEDLHTRMFLSHKRSTAQHIAGRLWESYHKDYKVFLDSEAQFKIHDLERIVKDTDLFILILSGGYFNSQFCVAELSSALKNNTPVVVLQDASFKIPDGGFGDAFGLSAAEINRLLSTSPTFTWLPEYHHEAVLKIQNSVLGGSDQGLQLVRELQEQDHLFKKAIEKKAFDEETPFDLSRWEKFEILQDFIRCLHVNHKCSITHLNLTGRNLTQKVFLGILEQIPELEALNLTSFQASGAKYDFLGSILDLIPKIRKLVLNATFPDEKSVEKIPDKFPLLEEFSATNLANSSLSVIIQSCENLKKLSITSPTLDDTVMKLISTFRPNIELLYLDCNAVTDAGLQMITTSCKKVQSLSLLNCAITDLGMRNLVTGKLPLHTLKLVGTKMTDNTLLAIGVACPQLKKLVISGAVIESNGLQHLADKCTQLEILNLKKSKIKKDAVAPLANFTALKSLNLQDTGATGAAVDILQHCKFSLTKLNLVESNSLKDKDIKEITLKHPNLVSLSMRGENLTDQTLEFLSKNVPRLEKFKCISANKFSADGLGWLLAGCPVLADLDFTHCQLTDVFVRRLARSPAPLRSFIFGSKDVQESSVQYLRQKKPGAQVKKL